MAPGFVVFAAKNGETIYEKAFGYFDYSKAEKVTTKAVYDLASVTKICATTIAVMKLYNDGRIKLSDSIGMYIPLLRGTDKAALTIHDILLHEAGLVPYIPFYKDAVEPDGTPIQYIFHYGPDSIYNIPVAQYLFQRSNWKDVMLLKIAHSKLGTKGKYVYSDNDFIFLGKMVEYVTGMSLNKYVEQAFYLPMGLHTIGFLPLNRIPTENIVPTENDTYFRHQLLRGYVHDQGAAMFGGVAGHAGLFSNAEDVAAVMQMLMNDGVYDGTRYLDSATVALFTAYQSSISRRGFGFDKPEKDNSTSIDPYPSTSSSPLTFGHTGYTGIGTWADPATGLVFVFLSNRVNPDVNSRLQKERTREKLLEAFNNIARREN